MVTTALTSGTDLAPLVSAVGAVLLGLGALAAWATARATKQNYVTSGFRDLTDASAKEAADERAGRQRAEYQLERWRNYAYELRDELMAAGVPSKAIPPTDHPSEAP